METNKIDIAENFFSMIKNLSNETKLELINKITASLKVKNDTEDSDWEKLFGAWESDESADELIEEIKSSRYTDRKIEDI